MTPIPEKVKFFAFQYRCAMPYLPTELQVKIINTIPKIDWFKVIGVDFLECGLHEKKLWKDLNADEFGDLDENLVTLLTKCGYLIETLRLHTRKWSSDKFDLNKVLRGFSNLRNVDFSTNCELTDITFLSENSQLEKLNVHECTNISRLPLLGGILAFTHLQFLDVSECDQLKEKDILRIAKQLKQLRHLNARDTKSLSIITVKAVKSKLLCLEEFLFCPMIYEDQSADWLEIYMQHPILQICPAGLEIILEQNPHIL